MYLTVVCSNGISRYFNYFLTNVLLRSTYVLTQQSLAVKNKFLFESFLHH